MATPRKRIYTRSTRESEIQTPETDSTLETVLHFVMEDFVTPTDARKTCATTAATGGIDYNVTSAGRGISTTLRKNYSAKFFL